MSNRNFNFADVGQQSLGKQASPTLNKQPGGGYGAPHGNILGDLTKDQIPNSNSYSLKMEKQAKNQMNQMNYINSWNQNQLYQQQYYLEMQNQQINSLLQQQEQMKKELQMQRLAMEEQQRRKQLVSRQKEQNALDILDDYERLAGLGGGGISLRPKKSLSTSMDPHPYGVPSPFINNASLMLGGSPSPNYGYLSPQSQPSTSPQDMFFMMLLNQRLESNKKPDRASEMIMQSLDKQNQILSQLAGKVTKEREYSDYSESRELERKVKLLELELGKVSSQSVQSPSTIIIKVYSPSLAYTSKPMSDPNAFSPGQLMQLQAMMNGMGKYQNPFNANPQAQYLEEERRKLDRFIKHQKKKDHRRKTKLKDILKLLGLDEIPDDEPVEKQPTTQHSIPTEPSESKPTKDTATKRKSDRKKSDNPKSKTTIEPEDPVKLEEQRRQKEIEEKIRKKNRNRALLWTHFAKTRIAMREESHDDMITRIGLSMEATKQWVLKGIQKGLDMLIKNPKTEYALVPVGGKAQADKNIQSRIADIQKVLKTMFDGLTNNTKEELLPKDLLDLLANLSQDYKFLPQGYMFNFELQRMNFTYTASIKQANNDKTQMICCFYVLIRFLLGEVLFKVWELPNVQKTEQLGRAIKLASSIILYCVVEFVRSKVVVQKDPQSHLVPELRIKPRPGPIQFSAPMDLKDVDTEGGKKKADEIESIGGGLYRRDQLAYFEKKPMVDELKAFISGWAERMYNLVNSHYAEKRKQEMNK